jgi:hypothetical protein
MSLTSVGVRAVVSITNAVHPHAIRVIQGKVLLAMSVFRVSSADDSRLPPLSAATRVIKTSGIAPKGKNSVELDGLQLECRVWDRPKPILFARQRVGIDDHIVFSSQQRDLGNNPLIGIQTVPRKAWSQKRQPRSLETIAATKSSTSGTLAVPEKTPSY